MWINSTNLFDAAAGFGGYRESGLRPRRRAGRDVRVPEARRATETDELAKARATRTAQHASKAARDAAKRAASSTTPIAARSIDRTPKLFIGGKQARPDSRLLAAASSAPTAASLGEVGEGNRKDIRNAVEAAHAALGGWAQATGHNRAQILYYIAENLAARARRVRARASTR